MRLLRPLAAALRGRGGAAVSGPAAPLCRAKSVDAALSAIDAIETSERLRVASLVDGLRGLARRRGVALDLEDEALRGLARPASINPHRRVAPSLSLSKRDAEATVRRLLAGSRLSADELSQLLRSGADALRAEPIARRPSRNDVGRGTRRGRRGERSRVSRARERAPRRPHTVSQVADLEVVGRLTVVGDLHGSLADLGAALDLCGRPGTKTRRAGLALPTREVPFTSSAVALRKSSGTRGTSLGRTVYAR